MISIVTEEHSIVSTLKPVAVKILNKEYRVNCPQGSEKHLSEAGRYLDQKIREIRAGGRVVGLERMAMMAALNIAHELLLFRHQKEEYVESVTEQIERLQNKIDEALANNAHTHEEV
jgi:cell division protein ZapA